MTARPVGRSKSEAKRKAKSKRTWLNGREGSEGRRVFLTDLDRDTGCYGSDVVIGMMDFEAEHILQDEQGRDLRGVLELEVLKRKGTRKESRIRINKLPLYARPCSKEDSRQFLEEIVEKNPRVSSLLSNFGLQLEDNDDTSVG